MEQRNWRKETKTAQHSNAALLRILLSCLQCDLTINKSSLPCQTRSSTQSYIPVVHQEGKRYPGGRSLCQVAGRAFRRADQDCFSQDEQSHYPAVDLSRPRDPPADNSTYQIFKTLIQNDQQLFRHDHELQL